MNQSETQSSLFPSFFLPKSKMPKRTVKDGHETKHSFSLCHCQSPIRRGTNPWRGIADQGLVPLLGGAGIDDPRHSLLHPREDDTTSPGADLLKGDVETAVIHIIRIHFQLSRRRSRSRSASLDRRQRDLRDTPEPCKTLGVFGLR